VAGRFINSGKRKMQIEEIISHLNLPAKGASIKFESVVYGSFVNGGCTVLGCETWPMQGVGSVAVCR
jgi:hypothetical protein